MTNLSKQEMECFVRHDVIKGEFTKAIRSMKKWLLGITVTVFLPALISLLTYMYKNDTKLTRVETKVDLLVDGKVTPQNMTDIAKGK